MTQQNKLYEASMALIGDLINRRSHFNSFQNLCRVLCEYEQSIEQPEAIAGENQSAKDKEISELEDALLDIIQVNEWKEKYGEDERYLQALPVALKNAKKLIQKQYESKDI